MAQQSIIGGLEVIRTDCIALYCIVPHRNLKRLNGHPKVSEQNLLPHTTTTSPQTPHQTPHHRGEGGGTGGEGGNPFPPTRGRRRIPTHNTPHHSKRRRKGIPTHRDPTPQEDGLPNQPLHNPHHGRGGFPDHLGGGGGGGPRSA